MAGKGNYTPDRSGLQKIGRSKIMGKAMQSAAERGRRYAEGVAPRRSGEYAGAFEVEPAEVSYGRSNDRRAGAALVNKADHALAVEGRSRVLKHAVDAIEKGFG